jgi:hypothetical protein
MYVYLMYAVLDFSDFFVRLQMWMGLLMRSLAALRLRWLPGKAMITLNL